MRSSPKVALLVAYKVSQRRRLACHVLLNGLANGLCLVGRRHIQENFPEFFLHRKGVGGSGSGTGSGGDLVAHGNNNRTKQQNNNRTTQQT
jgi:hypothetical protein